jgi:hypothetical protein
LRLEEAVVISVQWAPHLVCFSCELTVATLAPCSRLLASLSPQLLLDFKLSSTYQTRGQPAQWPRGHHGCDDARSLAEKLQEVRARRWSAQHLERVERCKDNSQGKKQAGVGCGGAFELLAVAIATARANHLGPIQACTISSTSTCSNVTTADDSCQKYLSFANLRMHLLHSSRRRYIHQELFRGSQFLSQCYSSTPGKCLKLAIFCLTCRPEARPIIVSTITSVSRLPSFRALTPSSRHCS